MWSGQSWPAHIPPPSLPGNQNYQQQPQQYPPYQEGWTQPGASWVWGQQGYGGYGMIGVPGSYGASTPVPLPTVGPVGDPVDSAVIEGSAGNQEKHVGGLQGDAPSLNQSSQADSGFDESKDEELKEFDRQFKEWEEQYNAWRNENKDHPDKESLHKYEEDWGKYRSELLQKRDILKKSKIAQMKSEKVPNQHQQPPLLPPEDALSAMTIPSVPPPYMTNAPPFPGGGGGPFPAGVCLPIHGPPPSGLPLHGHGPVAGNQQPPGMMHGNQHPPGMIVGNQQLLGMPGNQQPPGMMPGNQQLPGMLPGNHHPPGMVPVNQQPPGMLPQKLRNAPPKHETQSDWNENLSLRGSDGRGHVSSESPAVSGSNKHSLAPELQTPQQRDKMYKVCPSINADNQKKADIGLSEVLHESGAFEEPANDGSSYNSNVQEGGEPPFKKRTLISRGIPGKNYFEMDNVQQTSQNSGSEPHIRGRGGFINMRGRGGLPGSMDGPPPNDPSVEWESSENLRGRGAFRGMGRGASKMGMRNEPEANEDSGFDTQRGQGVPPQFIHPRGRGRGFPSREGIEPLPSDTGGYEGESFRGGGPVRGRGRGSGGQIPFPEKQNDGYGEFDTIEAFRGRGMRGRPYGTGRGRAARLSRPDDKLGAFEGDSQFSESGSREHNEYGEFGYNSCGSKDIRTIDDNPQEHSWGRGRGGFNRSRAALPPHGLRGRGGPHYDFNKPTSMNDEIQMGRGLLHQLRRKFELQPPNQDLREEKDEGEAQSFCYDDSKQKSETREKDYGMDDRNADEKREGVFPSRLRDLEWEDNRGRFSGREPTAGAFMGRRPQPDGPHGRGSGFDRSRGRGRAFGSGRGGFTGGNQETFGFDPAIDCEGENTYEMESHFGARGRGRLFDATGGRGTRPYNNFQTQHDFRGRGFGRPFRTGEFNPEAQCQFEEDSRNFLDSRMCQKDFPIEAARGRGLSAPLNDRHPEIPLERDANKERGNAELNPEVYGPDRQYRGSFIRGGRGRGSQFGSGGAADDQPWSESSFAPDREWHNSGERGQMDTERFRHPVGQAAGRGIGDVSIEQTPMKIGPIGVRHDQIKDWKPPRDWYEDEDDNEYAENWKDIERRDVRQRECPPFASKDSRYYGDRDARSNRWGEPPDAGRGPPGPPDLRGSRDKSIPGRGSSWDSSGRYGPPQSYSDDFQRDYPHDKVPPYAPVTDRDRRGRGDFFSGQVPARDRHWSSAERGRHESPSQRESSSQEISDRDSRGRGLSGKPESSHKDHARPRAPTPVIEEEEGQVSTVDDLIAVPGRFMRPPKIAIILRGLPGSGKSTIARMIKEREIENGGSPPRILSLDDYFMVESEKIEVDRESGRKIKTKVMEYEFERQLEDSYRASLVKSFKKQVDDGFFSFLIVDCVNQLKSHFAEIYKHARKYGFEVFIGDTEADVAVCADRNIHSRTLAEITELHKGWEPTPLSYNRVDLTPLMQDAGIEDVEMDLGGDTGDGAKKTKEEEKSGDAVDDDNGNRDEDGEETFKGGWKNKRGWSYGSDSRNEPDGCKRDNKKLRVEQSWAHRRPQKWSNEGERSLADCDLSLKDQNTPMDAERHGKALPLPHRDWKGPNREKQHDIGKHKHPQERLNAPAGRDFNRPMEGSRPHGMEDYHSQLQGPGNRMMKDENKSSSYSFVERVDNKSWHRDMCDHKEGQKGQSFDSRGVASKGSSSQFTPHDPHISGPSMSGTFSQEARSRELENEALARGKQEGKTTLPSDLPTARTESKTFRGQSHETSSKDSYKKTSLPESTKASAADAWRSAQFEKQANVSQEGRPWTSSQQSVAKSTQGTKQAIQETSTGRSHSDTSGTGIQTGSPKFMYSWNSSKQAASKFSAVPKLSNKVALPQESVDSVRKPSSASTAGEPAHDQNWKSGTASKPNTGVSSQSRESFKTGGTSLASSQCSKSPAQGWNPSERFGGKLAGSVPQNNKALASQGPVSSTSSGATSTSSNQNLRSSQQFQSQDSKPSHSQDLGFSKQPSGKATGNVPENNALSTGRPLSLSSSQASRESPTQNWRSSQFQGRITESPSQGNRIVSSPSTVSSKSSGTSLLGSLQTDKSGPTQDWSSRQFGSKTTGNIPQKDNASPKGQSASSPYSRTQSPALQAGKQSHAQDWKSSQQFQSKTSGTGIPGNRVGTPSFVAPFKSADRASSAASQDSKPGSSQNWKSPLNSSDRALVDQQTLTQSFVEDNAIQKSESKTTDNFAEKTDTNVTASFSRVDTDMLSSQASTEKGAPLQKPKRQLVTMDGFESCTKKPITVKCGGIVLSSQQTSKREIPAVDRSDALAGQKTQHEDAAPKSGKAEEESTPQSQQGPAWSQTPQQVAPQPQTNQQIIHRPQALTQVGARPQGLQQRAHSQGLQQGTPRPQTPQQGTLQPQTPQQGTPRPQTPQQGTPRPQTPQQEILRPQTPQQGFPRAQAPQQGTPRPQTQHWTPRPQVAQHGTPRPQAPQQWTPRPHVPQQGAPCSQTPQKWSPRPQLPQHGTLRLQTPQPWTTRSQVPQQGISRPQALQGVPRAQTPQQGTPRPQTPQQGTPRPQTPQQGTPRPQTPQQGTPVPQIMQQGTPNPQTPQQGTPRPQTPQQGTRIPQTPQQGTPITQTPQQGTPHPQTPQQGTPIPQTPQQGTPHPQTPQQGTPILQTPQLGTPILQTPHQGTPSLQTPQQGTPMPQNLQQGNSHPQMSKLGSVGLTSQQNTACLNKPSDKKSSDLQDEAVCSGQQEENKLAASGQEGGVSFMVIGDNRISPLQPFSKKRGWKVTNLGEVLCEDLREQAKKLLKEYKPKVALICGFHHDFVSTKSQYIRSINVKILTIDELYTSELVKAKMLRAISEWKTVSPDTIYIWGIPYPINFHAYNSSQYKKNALYYPDYMMANDTRNSNKYMEKVIELEGLLSRQDVINFFPLTNVAYHSDDCKKNRMKQSHAYIPSVSLSDGLHLEPGSMLTGFKVRFKNYLLNSKFCSLLPKELVETLSFA